MMSISKRNKQRHIDTYKAKSSEELIDEKAKIESEMMQEAIATYSDMEVLALLAMRHGYIQHEISQRIVNGSW